jgi:hypothetical protein
MSRSEVKFSAEHCTITIRRPAPGVVVLVLTGKDVGELGDQPFQELASDLGGPPVELFVDARSVVAASLDVSSDWARWLATHKRQLRHVSMLTGSPFIQLTAGFVRRFADLGEVMRIYTDPAAFDGALASSVANAASGG